MGGLEFNKIAAGVLIAGLVAMVSGKLADALYQPEPAQKRGFEVAAMDDSAGGAAETKEPIKLGALLAAADVDAGQKAAKKCAACHTFNAGGANGVGPNLAGVVGAKKATHAGFDYSDALKGLGGNWDYEALYHFINSPRKYAKGTKMAFAGIRDPQELANLIAYLRTLGGNAPLPPESLEIQP